ncbi:hypothetical protein WH47_05369 [Habropoda laboriosa]|uniref:Uncharacterized protein n=1 Tax=Habropoda laboriosa TaxID=597456 RepID=A0A0L7RK91_9HYME|nr:hypothetical protein WH47_05369 [Habropoda laboriosa]
MELLEPKRFFKHFKINRSRSMQKLKSLQNLISMKACSRFVSTLCEKSIPPLRLWISRSLYFTKVLILPSRVISVKTLTP